MDRLADAVGLPRADMRQIAEQVKANHAALAACPRHHFEPIDDGRTLLKRHRCSACSGEVDHHAAYWYAQGLKHGGAK
jgi:hypothetical protein